MPNRPRTPLLAAAALGLAALALSGCAAATDATAGPTVAADTQTVAEACAQLQTEMSAFSADLGDAVDELDEDPQAARDLLAQLETELQDSSAALGNSTVATGAHEMAVAVGAMVDAMDAGIENPDDEQAAADFGDAATAVQAAGETMGQICG